MGKNSQKSIYEADEVLIIIFTKSLDMSKLQEECRLMMLHQLSREGTEVKEEIIDILILSSMVGKLGETIIAENIRPFLGSNKMLNSSQHGFKPGMSYGSYLLSFEKETVQTIDEGGQYDTI